MRFSKEETQRIRELAKRVADIAADGRMAANKARWSHHNDLVPHETPLLLVSPEGAWKELLPASQLVCENKLAREWEWKLLCRIYRGMYLKDDFVIPPDWTVFRHISDTGWGISPRFPDGERNPSEAWDFDNILGFLPKVWDDNADFGDHTVKFIPVLHSHEDLKKIQIPIVTEDEAASKQELELAHEVFNGILPVKQKGISRISFHPMAFYTQMRGHEQALFDMLDEPGMVHEAMARFEEGYHALIRQYVEMNFLSLNNDETYHASGGFGYSNEFPQPGFDPAHIRPCDMWAFAESQEMAAASPEMHEEFARAYEKRLLAPFGRNGYGCCEPMENRLTDVFTIPSLRRISVSPFSNVASCAKQIGGRYIFSCKPNPALLAGHFSESVVREELRGIISAIRENHCCAEIILKDTSTCGNEPQRFAKWIEIARQTMEE